MQTTSQISLRAESLQFYKVLALIYAKRALSEVEASDITSFVRRGCYLSVLLGPNVFETPDIGRNLFSQFGVSIGWRDPNSDIWVYTVVEGSRFFRNHEITAGVTSLSFYSSTYLSNTGSLQCIVYDDWMCLLAVGNVGSGAVILSTLWLTFDDEHIDDQGYVGNEFLVYGNRQLASNIVAWLWSQSQRLPDVTMTQTIPVELPISVSLVSVLTISVVSVYAVGFLVFELLRRWLK